MNYNYSYEQTIYTSAYFNRIIDSELSKTPFYTKIIEDYKKVTKDPILLRQVQTVVEDLCFQTLHFEEEDHKSPRLINVDSVNPNIFIFAFYISMPFLEDVVKRRNIRHDIFVESMKEILWKMLRAEREGKQYYSINILWLWRIFTLEVFRLGRLQYGLGKLTDNIVVLENINTHRLVLISDSQKIASKGLINGTGGITEIECWDSSFNETPCYYIGNNNISIEGLVIKREGFYDKRLWKVIGKNETKTIEVHVPEGEPLNISCCIDSMNQAKQFWRDYKPNRNLFTCRSWLMDYKLSRCLEFGSNILSFQQMFYLYPIQSNMEEVWYRVFGDKKVPSSDFVIKTSLQSKILREYNNGMSFSRAGGLLIV